MADSNGFGWFGIDAIARSNNRELSGLIVRKTMEIIVQLPNSLVFRDKRSITK